MSTAARKARKRAGVKFEHPTYTATGPREPARRFRGQRPLSGAQLQLVMELARAFAPPRTFL